MRIPLFALALLALSGCDILFPQPTPDNDGDGFPEDIDCDDADATVSPFAEEICDGVDNDCDGEVDEPGAADATTWYQDADGDDYGDPAFATVTCEAPQDWVALGDGLDCDDGDASIHPDAEEHCNGLDDDCDGQADEDAEDATVWYQDSDGDGYGTEDIQLLRCEEPEGFVDTPGDCDDAWPEVRPGADEVCDGLDNDCDGTTDEADALDSRTWYLDADGDGWGLTGSTTVACWQPSAYAEDDGDCDDSESAVNPGASEVCNDVDDDCDGDTDEADDAVDATTWYADRDADGYGDATVSVTTCTAPSGYVADATDCDDTTASVHPGATELCDAADVDEDCDGLADDLDSSVSAASRLTFYRDDDGDGYGGSVRSVARCDAPSGYVDATLGEDCDDGDSHVHPGATEICDTTATDDDCDGLVNGDDPGVDAATFVTWYLDSDGDGYGEHATTAAACDAPSGYVADDTDCDDADAAVSPAGSEVCDDADVDEDCDGLTDDWDPSVDAASMGTWYQDLDGDGYGDASSSRASCDELAGYVADGTDCDDGEADVHPGAQEVCDADDVDEDCDGRADDLDRSVSAATQSSYYADDDGDGYGDPEDAETACDAPSGYVSDGTDCDDTRAGVNPAQAEICDSANLDEDCDGLADDTDPSVSSTTFSTFYADSDGDGYGDLAVPRAACDAPSGYVSDFTDCNDASAGAHPGATEVCNYVDDDCDGSTDEAVTVTYWQDVDLDGEGGPTTSGQFCEATPSSGWSASNTDCDDADRWVYTGAPELCDGQQNDCRDTAWSASYEDETASLESTSGAWSDLTSTWNTGTPVRAASVTLPASGTVHLCPADWYVRLTAPSGADVTIVGDYGRADTTLNGASGGSVVSIPDGTITLTLTDLTIEEGLASMGAGVKSVGGALTVTDCLFRYNYISATSSGQGAGIYASGGAVTVSGTTFRSNGVDTGTSTFGGGMFVANADLDVSDCSFENGDAGTGGGLYWTASGDSALALDSVTFDGNEASSGDGGGAWIGALGTGDVSITGCTFTDDMADGDGGGLYLGIFGASDVALQDNEFEYCLAGDWGGGLHHVATSSAGTHTFDGLTFTGCEADQGGGVSTLGDLDLIDVSVSSCVASEGGGIAVLSGSIVTLDGVTVSGNEAETLGAGVYADTAVLLLTDCSVDSNEVPASASACYGGTYDDPLCAGAGIYALRTDVDLTDTDVTDNVQHTTLDTFGGGVYLADGELSVSGGEISGNGAAYGAGVLASGGGATTSVTLTGGAQVTANDGAHYAGLYLDTATFSCTGTSTENTGVTAHLDGGGIYLHYEHASGNIAEVSMCDFGASGTPSDNYEGSTSDRDLYLAGFGWYAKGNDQTFDCTSGACGP
ncbi:MAG: MopE-related protein [Pseudomonadota bacterium]